MQDTLHCPICKQKFLNKYQLLNFGKNNEIINVAERLCNGISHTLKIKSNTISKEIIFVKISLDSTYSKYLEVDYIQDKSSISCYKPESRNHYVIDIGSAIPVDFNNLNKLKDKINTYVMLS